MKVVTQRLVASVVALGLLSYGAKVVLLGTSLGALGGPPVLCNVNDKCAVDASAAPDGLFGLGCVVNSNYSIIQVDKGYKPRIVWSISQGSGDSAKYRFDTNGIEPKAGENDPNTDLSDPGYEDTFKKKFHWNNKNKLKKDVHFDVNVSKLVLGIPIPCRAQDPLIANAGN